MMAFGMLSCSSLFPWVILLGFAVYLFIWLKEKRQRDELVLDLMVEIEQIMVEILDLLKQQTKSRRP